MIKLNGKNSGHAAVYSALSSRDVDICIVPEFNFELYGDTGLLNHAYQRLKIKKYCVIVITEGTIHNMLDYDEKLHSKYNGDIAHLIA